ncbi:polysaccharide lyase family 1 protein [Annulohypoxylon truncatum]|uniref:polysaccharide lyase family 1 protein n=1 Tax=Annulohypoxylon truncatum TaxID=327061 RepID=UPI002007EE20|nr:polysaccharide lyase family 1 protein [Annulohypoxylon truncatum]KAI1213670.1 polysaccharide lyase family 1 protein [Annulohypoxylon truncatum]
MKYSTVAWLAAIASASPYNLLETRNKIASRQASEACSIGYCTQNGGTTGGLAGETITVTDVDSLTEAAGQEGPLTIIVSGAISGSAKVHVSANKTIYGEEGSSLTGVGLYIRRTSNVIVRNMKIAKVPAENGDAIGIDASSNVWVDHCDLSGDLNSGKDDYDGLVDISHGSEWITVSNTYFHDHWKASLIGHSDSNAEEDVGALHVTYAGNHFYNTYSRAPLVRFGTVHIVNTFWDSLIASGVNCRMGAQVLIQSSAFRNSCEKAVFFADSEETGYAVLDDVDLGGSENSAPEGTLAASSLPYAPIETLGSAAVASMVPSAAGQKL